LERVVGGPVDPSLAAAPADGGSDAWLWERERGVLGQRGREMGK